jgi:hypothetical protein
MIGFSNVLASTLSVSERETALKIATEKLHADSDEAARVYRTYSAHRSNLMPPTNPI